MTDSDSCAEDFDQLLSSLCDAGLEPQQVAGLNRLLRSDPDLRRRYLLYMGVHAALHYVIGAPTGGAADPDSQDSHEAPDPGETFGKGPCAECGRSRSYSRFWSWARAAAAALILAGVGGSIAWWWPRRFSPPGFAKAAPIVARISKGAGVRFDGNGPSAGVNDPLRAGTYRLVAGIVQVAFARGAEVMITAPAEFALKSEEKLYLKRGKLTAKVSERAKGFTVETPSATLVDLGTEFAADVDPYGNGEVHVFRGEVIVQPRSLTDSRPLRLTEAQATRIDAASATPSGIEVDSTRFLRQLEEPRSSYSRLVSELGPKLYLHMEPTVDGHSVIDSCSHDRLGRVVLSPSNGTPWFPGCFGSSLRLRGPGFGEYATMPSIEKPAGNTLSVVAWVFAESRPRWASIAKRWGEPGDRCFHFGLFGDDGDLEVHVAQPNGEEALAREGRPLPTGRWHQVAFVADGTTLHLYRNGVEVARAPHAGLQSGTLDVLGVGVKLDKTGGRPDPFEPGYWHGRLDEISVFSKALKPDQIRQLHQSAARPEPNGQP